MIFKRKKEKKVIQDLLIEAKFITNTTTKEVAYNKFIEKVAVVLKTYHDKKFEDNLIIQSTSKSSVYDENHIDDSKERFKNVVDILNQIKDDIKYEQTYHQQWEYILFSLFLAILSLIVGIFR